MLAKFERAQSYTVYSQPGLVLEDLLTFDFWARAAHHFKLNDLITVVALDGAFDVTMRVVLLGNNSIEFRILREWRPEITGIDDMVDAPAADHYLANADQSSARIAAHG